ncbi:DUF63 family protein [Halobaculum gomorrense]|uniref:Uncharacterized membrane protein n=1 Tax=Halobaculum gomorrense TaxID=43928 RepID=A0A1M5KPZ7_9EURY|nr:DUF63 family protein [Halobaculum gomorrense]SHG54805.1 Uncharacterized membrane protein [Halobaculum gomorrense]
MDSYPTVAPLPGQLLPTGFGLPPLPYLAGLALALAGVALAVRRRDPEFGGRHVLALVPWMCVGAAGHVLSVVGALPAAVAPLFGTPSAYFTTAAAAGTAWVVALAAGRDDARALGLAGAVTLLPAVAGVVAYGIANGTLSPVLPAAGLVVGAALGVGVGALLYRLREGAAVAGRAGLLAVAAHGVDGVTTAVGIDLLGFGERTPASRVIIEFAAGLPTADALGAGWLFVLVKLAVACLVVVAVAPTVREEPRYGYGLLALVTAVGLGPGVHNALLFAVEVA